MKSATVRVAAVLVTLTCAGAAAAADLDPQLMGAYAPGGDCSKEPRVTIGKTLTVQAAGRANVFSPVDACYSCAGGARYEGIEVWVTYLGKDGDPVYPMFRVNADEKRGQLVVDRNEGDLKGAPPAVRAVAMASPLKKCPK